MLGTLCLEWRRALAFSLIVSTFIVTLGINTSVYAQKRASESDTAPQVESPAAEQPTVTESLAPSVVFSNTTAIPIADRVGTTPGVGNPYPSNIAVSGLSGTITKVTVTIRNLTHAFPDDVELLVVSPNGTKLLIQSDTMGGTAANNLTYTFDQAAAAQISDTAQPANNSSVRPGNYAGNGGATFDVFPAPAPGVPYVNPGPEAGGTAGNLDAFNGANPNGTWSLYAIDDESLDTGGITGGWSIDITVSAPPVAAKPCYDFFGSGRTSFATFNTSATAVQWKLQNNGGAGSQEVFFGASATDALTPGYFDGDSIADINVWRPGANSTYFLRPSTAPTSVLGIQWGTTGDVVGREADYDGDGRDDPTVVRRVSNVWNWFYLRSSNGTLGAIQFGVGNNTATEDIPLPGADYAGDGRADLVVLRTNATGDGTYLIGDSNTGALLVSQQWGNFNTDFYITGDYVGDGKADFAVWRGFGAGTNGIWYIRENGGTGQQLGYQWGTPGAAATRDIAVCGDYNGDGKSDIAVYRRSNSTYYWINSPGNTTVGNQAVAGGAATDLPVGLLKTF